MSTPKPRPHRCSTVLLSVALAVFATTALASRLPPPTLTAEGDANAGYVTLSWTPDEDPEGAPPRYLLQEASSPEFGDPKTRYEGAHTSTVLSGMTDGARWYRVRRTSGRTPGAWSEPRRFDVEHHPLSLAGALFAMGAFVFVATAGFILRAGKED